MQAEDVCRICEEDEPHRLLLLIAISKGRVGAKEVHERDEPHRLPFLIAISKGRVAQRMFAELTNPIGVLLLIAQGCQTIVQATLG